MINPFRSLALTRLTIGLAQGLALVFLWDAAAAQIWPATSNVAVAAILIVLLFVPLITEYGLGHLRAQTLLLWTAAAAVLCASLAWYAVASEVSSAPFDARSLYPLWGFAFWFGPTVFILNALIVSGDKEKRFIAAFPTYFDVAWLQAVQLALVALFVGTLWALLFLGAALFALIKIDAVYNFITHRGFWIPVTAMAASYAIHLTDVRASLVVGARTLLLTLLSWLLPILAAITLAFVLTLPFTGLEALWSTGHASVILLAAVAAHILFMNAAYQDGKSHLLTPLRVAFLASALIMVPLAALAAYALSLRVQQYGWTPQRIYLLACVVIAASHAFGYALAVTRRRFAPPVFESTNIFNAFLAVGIVLALHSPVADPKRIAIRDQAARLKDGRTTPAEFDYRFLARDAGRHGRAALEELSELTEGENARVISEKSRTALAQSGHMSEPAFVPTPQARAANIAAVYPAGQSVPDSLLQQDWEGQRYQLPRCLNFRSKCEALVADFDGDGTPEVALWNDNGSQAVLFKRKDDTWILVGHMQNMNCAGVRDAIRDGRFELTQPEIKELRAAERRVYLSGDCRSPLIP